PVQPAEVADARLRLDPRPAEHADGDQVDPGLLHQPDVLRPDLLRPLLGVVVAAEQQPSVPGQVAQAGAHRPAPLPRGGAELSPTTSRHGTRRLIGGASGHSSRSISMRAPSLPSSAPGGPSVVSRGRNVSATRAEALASMSVRSPGTRRPHSSTACSTPTAARSLITATAVTSGCSAISRSKASRPSSAVS